MPRPRARSIFELGGYWLSTIPNREGLYAFWTDARNGGTRRQSLGTSDIEQAKLKLAEIVLKGAPATANSPLSIILENYFLARTDHLPSKDPARASGRVFLEQWGIAAKVSDISEDQLKTFARALVKKGNSLGYIARHFTVLSAALRHAGITLRVIFSEAHMRNVWKIAAKPKRKVFIPTDQQLALILRQPMPEDLSRWLLIEMTTGCRPEAAIDLSPASRIPEAQAIDLNPPGRAQNKKHRPIVRAPKVLTVAMNRWEKAGLDEHGGRYCGYASVDSADSALERVCKKIGLGAMSVYSLRHKVTTVLRAAGVPGEQISRQLGHSRSGEATTEAYGEFSPDFQKAASDALDAWVRRLRQLEIATKSPRQKLAGRRAA
jgi:integrase